MIKCPSQNVLKLKLTITWKLHMLSAHLEPLPTRLGRGLGIYCEQAGEAVHHKMKKTKARFKRNEYHQRHGQAQKTVVVHWSSWNVHSINKTSINKYREGFWRRRMMG